MGTMALSAALAVAIGVVTSDPLFDALAKVSLRDPSLSAVLHHMLPTAPPLPTAKQCVQLSLLLRVGSRVWTCSHIPPAHDLCMGNAGQVHQQRNRLGH